MLKIKNKFIIFVISVLVSILTIGIFTLFTNTVDRTSYAILLKGDAKYNENFLSIDEKQSLNQGDKLKTIGNNSMLVVEWGDGSITRLGGNTSIEIKNLDISDNLENINVGVELFSGKTWSNIVSFLGEKSYFKHYFRDYEAASRGTTFNIDLNNNYINVTDHEVALSKTGEKEIIIGENNPFNINTFSFIELQDFIKGFKDNAFESLNKQIDKKLIGDLTTQINKDFDKIKNVASIEIKNNLNIEDKKELYNKLLTEYQKLNFAKPNNKELYATKIELKTKLITLSSNEDKKILVNSTLYDFKDILDSRSYAELEKTIKVLYDNKESLGDVDFSKYSDLNNISDQLKNIFNKNKQMFESIFGKSFSDNLNGIDINDLKKIGDKAEGIIHKGLNDLKNKATNLIDNK